MATLLDSTGAVIARESFNAYGTRRNPGTWSGQVSATGLDTSFNISRQGYTWQTALGYTSLNHMNARVQDSATGVFLSADSLISQPGYTQSYNRYGYVNNNPLSYNDPSGHCPHNNGYTPPDNNGPGYELEEVVVYGYIDDSRSANSSSWDFTPFDWNLLRDWYNDYFNNNNVDSAPAKRAPQPVPQSQKSVLGQLKDFVCSLPSVEAGFGADVYAGLGTSVGIGFKIDLASGQIGISGNLAFGVGFGADVGPSVGGSPSGSGIVSANATASGGVGLGVAGVATQNLVGSDAGQRGYSVGRVGTPIGFANVGASVGLSTPKANIFGCGK